MTPLDAVLKETETNIRLLEAMDSSDIALSDRLMENYNRFESLQHQNSLRWAQRAHLLWLKNGDQNTTFFHNSVRIQSHYNIISQISVSSGNIASDHSSIENMFVNFYTNLWTDNSNNNFIDIYNDLPNDLPTLTDLKGALLT